MMKNEMRNVFLTTLFLFGCLLANGQNYLQEGDACFEKGDYECAKRNYNLFQTFDGRDMSAQIQKADECMRALILADGYFKDEEWARARERYRFILEKNPKDRYALKQYDVCEEQLKPKEEMIVEKNDENMLQEKDNFVEKDNQQITVTEEEARPAENINLPVRVENKPDNLPVRKESTGRRPGTPLFIVGGLAGAGGIAATFATTKSYMDIDKSKGKIIRGKETNYYFAAAGVIVGGICIGSGILLNRKAHVQSRNKEFSDYSPSYRNNASSKGESRLNIVACGNEVGLRLTF